MSSFIKQAFLMALLCLGIVTITNAKGNDKIIGKEVTYTFNHVTMKGYIAYDGSIKGKRPAIVVVPEWWGNNEYTKGRARMLAELGYIAIAADFYGDGKIAENPTQAQEYATPFYKDANIGKDRLEAAITELKEFPETDANKIAAIGYCFGGSMVLNAIKMGTDLKGVVSFHGGLMTAPASKGMVKGKILVCHGGSDKFIPADDIANFRKNLDTTGVNYTFITYTNATHAFTNPDATANGKKFNLPIEYNKEADKKSWNDMKDFFKTIF